MELLLLFLFALGLVTCVFTDTSILAAMVFGYFLFLGYGLVKKHSLLEMLTFSFKGILTIKNVLISFILIGILTAVWRACGSIAFIVYHASALCIPSVMLLITFLLCSLVSFLTGTSFGSAATMGVICMTIASGMGIPVSYTGGAVLSGIFFGDRCSPVSTSALLVSELTKTDLFSNMKTMVRTSAIPFALSCIAYFFLGATKLSEAVSSETTRSIFQENFELSILTLIPVAAVLIFSLCHINVKITLAVSALLGSIIALYVQQLPLIELPALFFFGFHPSDAALSRLMSGGGILSMVKVFCIVCISSCYAGIFQGTGFLDGIQTKIQQATHTMSALETTTIISIITACISCNQTLSIILTHQICKPNYSNNAAFASDLENTAVIIAPLIPWSIAGAAPLAAAGAPTVSILFAFYLFLIPIWNLLKEKTKCAL